MGKISPIGVVAGSLIILGLQVFASLFGAGYRGMAILAGIVCAVQLYFGWNAAREHGERLSRTHYVLALVAFTTLVGALGAPSTSDYVAAVAGIFTVLFLGLLAWKNGKLRLVLMVVGLAVVIWTPLFVLSLYAEGHAATNAAAGLGAEGSG